MRSNVASILPRAHRLHDRDLQAFLEHLARIGRADLAADVRRVRDRAGEADELRFDEISAWRR